MEWKIEFDSWDAPDSADLTGYNCWDYLPDYAAGRRFASQEEAEEYVAQNTLGPDEYGVEATFRAVPAE